MALAVNLRYENKSYASAFDQSRRSLLLRPIRIALLLKLAVPVRMGYTCPYGSGVRTQTPRCLSHGVTMLLIDLKLGVDIRNHSLQSS